MTASRLYRLIAFLALLIAVPAGAASAQTASTAGNTTAEARIENEYKLNVPLQEYDRVWSFVTDTYVTRKRLADVSTDFTAQSSVEFFSDQYYDDDDFTLKANQNGVRIRSRYIPDDPANAKNGRRLLQVKMSRIDDKADLNRAEVKFEVNQGVGADFKHILPHIRPRDIHEFADIMAGLGVDFASLRKTVALKQERRRVYVSYRNEPFATITLDRIDSSYMMWSCRFAEVEIELNEILYTNVSESRRSEMEEVSGYIYQMLQKEFPFIHRDQTPKYNKTSNCLDEKVPFFETMLRLF